MAATTVILTYLKRYQADEDLGAEAPAHPPLSYAISSRMWDAGLLILDSEGVFRPTALGRWTLRTHLIPDAGGERQALERILLGDGAPPEELDDAYAVIRMAEKGYIFRGTDGKWRATERKTRRRVPRLVMICR